MTIKYQTFKSYKEAPARIQKQLDNFFKNLKQLRTNYIKSQSESDLNLLQAFYNKMHNSIIYKSSKYSVLYCQILSDVM